MLLTFFPVYARTVEITADKLVLNCSISGFSTNLPMIDYDWFVNDALIPHPHDQAAAAASFRTADELTRSPKFSVSLDRTELSLTVNNPSMCVFVLVYLFCTN